MKIILKLLMDYLEKHPEEVISLINELVQTAAKNLKEAREKLEIEGIKP